MEIAHLVRRALAIVFLGSLVLGGFGTYFTLKARALDEAAAESRVLLSTAMAVRAFTVEQIRPLLIDREDRFHPEIVPSFAAHSIFNRVRSQDAAYSYREAALNPTNPADLPEPFETELINGFRQDRDLVERTGLRQVGEQDVFFLARPIRIEDEACLSCHSTPNAAPEAMVAVYGPNNGFGWQMDEVVGVQILTVPINAELRGAYETVLILVGGLAIIFLLAYVLVASTIHHNIILPLQSLSDRADAASVGAHGEDGLPDDGSAEIRRLSSSIERLRISLGRALGRAHSAKTDEQEP